MDLEDTSTDAVFTRLLCASIAVPRIADVLPTYVEQLGFEQRGGLIESQRFRMNWVELGTGDRDRTVLELLEPTGDGPVQKFLDTRPPGVYQIRFGVRSMDEAVAALRARGSTVIVGEHVSGHPDVAWIHPRSTGGVLIELFVDDDS